MTKIHSEISSLTILGTSMLFATVGTVAYVLITPMEPAKRIAVAFSAITQSITR